MKNTREYTINWATETITITKKFGKAASDFNTPEFREMQILREQYKGFKFEYKVVKKNSSKNSYKGLTIDEMRRFVSTQSEKEIILFDKVIALAETKKSKYAIVKKWFMDKYKDAYAMEIAAQEYADIELELANFEDEVEEVA